MAYGRTELLFSINDEQTYHDLFAKYDTLTKISFDYAVVEKEKKIQVQRFAGQWKDLGTWNTLTEAMEERRRVLYSCGHNPRHWRRCAGGGDTGKLQSDLSSL